jgi:hypothetical protein
MAARLTADQGPSSADQGRDLTIYHWILPYRDSG